MRLTNERFILDELNDEMDKFNDIHPDYRAKARFEIFENSSQYPALSKSYSPEEVENFYGRVWIKYFKEA